VTQKKHASLAEARPGQPLADIFCIGEARRGQRKTAPSGRSSWKTSPARSRPRSGARPPRTTPTCAPASSPGRGTGRQLPHKTQVNVDRLRVLSPEEFTPDLSQFVASSSEPPEVLWRSWPDLRTNIAHAPWRKFVAAVLAHPEFRAQAPRSAGAKSVHHGYRAACSTYPGRVRGPCHLRPLSRPG